MCVSISGCWPITFTIHNTWTESIVAQKKIEKQNKRPVILPSVNGRYRVCMVLSERMCGCLHPTSATCNYALRWWMGTMAKKIELRAPQRFRHTISLTLFYTVSAPYSLPVCTSVCSSVQNENITIQTLDIRIQTCCAITFNKCTLQCKAIKWGRCRMERGLADIWWLYAKMRTNCTS